MSNFIKMNGLRFTLCVLLIGLGTIAQAQFPMGGSKGPTIKGKIEGKIIDSLTQNAVGFATISLKKKGSSIVIDGVLSNEDGTFVFENVVNGAYDMNISFLGYNEKMVTTTTTLKEPDVNIGAISIGRKQGR